MRHLLWFVPLIAFTTFSCQREDSSAVNQDRIFTEYELFYNANEDKTYARATFKFSNIFGTKLELSDPSEVIFNGDILTFNTVLAYYEKEFSGFVQSGTFEWKDLDGNTFVNAVSIPTIDYNSAIDTIDRSSSFELAWQGDPLGPNELVNVFINGENEADAQIFSTNDVESQSIILGANKLGNLGAGPGIVVLERVFLPAISDGTSAGGRLQGRYRPQNQEIVVK